MGIVVERPRGNARRRAEIRVTQRYDTPAERVFDAWVNPAIAGRWLFATASRPVPSVEIDARPGGAFRFEDRENGAKVVRSGVYVEIDRPRRLVFTLSAGRRTPFESRVIADFTPLDAGCELTLTHENVPPGEAGPTEGRWMGMLHGLGETISRRAAGTSGKRGG